MKAVNPLKKRLKSKLRRIHQDRLNNLSEEEQKKEKEKNQTKKIEMMREIRKKYPDISLERVIELLNIGFSKAQEEMIKEGYEEVKE